MKIEMTPEILEKVMDIGDAVVKIFKQAFNAGFAPLSDCENVDYYRVLCATEAALQIRESVDDVTHYSKIDEVLSK